MRIGSLFSGAGGLDMAVEQVFGARTVWHCENDKAASKVLAHRFPGVPNHHDITVVDWDAVEPVDILCGGFPCQDVSSAAADRRLGLKAGTRSGLWSEMAGAIAVLGPRIVIIENVKGLLSAKAHRDMESGTTDLGDTADGPVLRAAGAVLGDLADLGYDAVWATVSAVSVGAPHRRERVFIIAQPTGQRCERYLPQTETGLSGRHSDQGFKLLTTPQSRDWKGTNSNYGGPWQSLPRDLLPTPQSANLPEIGNLLPTPSVSDGTGGPNNPHNRRTSSDKWAHSVQLIDLGMLPEDQWGRYSQAVKRWEHLTRPAPPPVEPTATRKRTNSAGGTGRLNAAFAEWMMGWPAGWVTAVPGISRSDALKIIGNGVIPAQAAAALAWLLQVAEVSA